MSTLQKIKKIFSVREVPLQNKPVDVFRAAIEEMSWQKVLEFKENFIPRGNDPWAWHDRELSSLLWRRLFRLEQPVFHFDNDKDQIFKVASGLSRREIKDLIAREMTPAEAPKFVVEDSGKVRGFALAPTLVVVGCVPICTTPEKIIKNAGKLGVHLPTEEDAILIDKNREKLNQMMLRVGVPSLVNVSSFLLASSARNNWDFPVWILSCARKSSIEWDDMTFLLAKM